MARLLWPHEFDWATVPELTPTEAALLHQLKLARMESLLRVRLSRPSRKVAHLRDLERAESLLCTGLTLFEGKYEFARLVRDLGFLAPASVLTMPGQVVDLEAIRRLDNDPGRFCKPLYGSMSRGTFSAASVEAAVRFVGRQRRPYLVQQLLPPVDGEYRCILLRTESELRAGAPPGIRMTFEKIGPWVSGSGIPRCVRLVKKLCWRDPETGLRLRYRRLPDPERLAQLDSYMLNLLVVLEKRLAVKLPVLCVDLGFSRQGPVLYEAQMPFSNPWKWGLKGDEAVRTAMPRMIFHVGCIAGHTS